MGASDWIGLATAIGTCALAVIAIYGDAIKKRHLKNSLKISLHTPKGEFAKQMQRSVDEGGELRNVIVDCRYYHVQVTNRRRYPAVTGVQLFVIAFDGLGPNGQPQRQWTGEIPLGWRHAELFPLQRSVGPEAVADLIYVSAGNPIHVCLSLFPFNFPAPTNTATTFWLTLQARGNECDSEPVRYKISWNGKWHTGEVEMSQHLIIEKG